MYNVFAAKLGSQANSPTLELLTSLFFAIASPEAVGQLRQTCYVRRTSNSSHLYPKGETISEATKALETIEGVLSSCSIIRRYHLLSLARRRELLIQQYKLKPTQRTRTRTGGMEKFQKAESSALQDLYNEAYNTREPPTKLQTKLKNWLRYGRNWAFLAQEFSIGVLALLPTGGNTALTNSQYVLYSLACYLLTFRRIERVNEQDFLTFLDILQQERGEFIRQMAVAVDDIYADILFNAEPIQSYRFEDVEQDVLDNAAFDDKTLLEYCAKAPKQ